MKSIGFLFILFVFVFISCQKDEIFSTDPESESSLKSAEVKMVPMKVDFYCIPTVFNEGIPVAGNIAGIASHVGKVDKEKSTFMVIGVEIIFPKLLEQIVGVIHAPNGDTFNYSLNLELDLTTNKFTGVTTMNGGTGRFENVSGTIAVNGSVNVEGVASWIGNGMVSNVGSSK